MLGATGRRPWGLSSHSCPSMCHAHSPPSLEFALLHSIPFLPFNLLSLPFSGISANALSWKAFPDTTSLEWGTLFYVARKYASPPRALVTGVGPPAYLAVRPHLATHHSVPGSWQCLPHMTDLINIGWINEQVYIAWGHPLEEDVWGKLLDGVGSLYGFMAFPVLPLGFLPRLMT